MYIMFCLCDRPDVCTKCNFVNFSKTDFFQCCFNLPKANIRSKLTDNSRCQFHDNFIPLFHCLNQLENLGFICNRTKWATDHTLTAFYADIIIDMGTSVLIAGNRLYATCHRTRSLFFCNRIVRTDGLTFSTFNTFFFINIRPSIYHGNRTTRTYLLAGMCHAATALITHFVTTFLTSGTSRWNNLHQRRLIIFI